MNRREEQDLIERATAGEHEAAECLIRAHQASLYSYLLRMCGKPDLAEDIVQDAFVRVLMNLHRFDPRYRFSTWLFTIAKRLLVNACQKLKPVYDSEIVGSWGSSPNDPGAPIADRETRSKTREAIDGALEQLGSQQREIIVLFHQQEWSIALIAQYMNMPEGTVKSHLHRGRKKMRRILERAAQDQGKAIADIGVF